MKQLVVWYNPKKDIYYYRVINDWFGRYYEGFINQYGHKVVCYIDIYDELIHKDPFIKKVLSKFIRFLQNIYRKL